VTLSKQMRIESWNRCASDQPTVGGGI
jgi:hypothetical protein